MSFQVHRHFQGISWRLEFPVGLLSTSLQMSDRAKPAMQVLSDGEVSFEVILMVRAQGYFESEFDVSVPSIIKNIHL